MVPVKGVGDREANVSVPDKKSGHEDVNDQGCMFAKGVQHHPGKKSDHKDVINCVQASAREG